VGRPLSRADRARAAVRLARKETFLKKHRAALRKATSKFFGRQAKAVRAGLAAKGHLQREGLASDLSHILDQVFVQTRVDYVRDMQTILTAVQEGAVRHRVADFGTDASLDLSNPKAVRYLERYCGGQVTKINDTTREVLAGIITRGVEQGTSYTTIANQIVDRLKGFSTPATQAHLRNRAELIAVYEAGEAYETASLGCVSQIADRGVAMEKASLDAGDGLVSKICKRNSQAGWIPLGQPFPSGHQRAQFHQGCRCTTLFQVRD
jgi:hypothetical protein